MKMMLGFLIGGVLGVILLAGPISFAGASANQADAPLAEEIASIRRIYREALIAPFQEVLAEIEDEKVAGFYSRLIRRAELDTP